MLSYLKSGVPVKPRREAVAKFAHGIGKNTVLTAVRLVRENDDIMIGNNRRDGRIVELLNESEDKARIAFEHFDELFPAGRNILIRLCSQSAAGFKGIADLFIEFLAIG